MVLKVEIDEKIEQKFRKMAMKKFGYKRGAIQKATEEAISNWSQFQSLDCPKVKDPFKLVEGILSHLKGKKTSIQLQHEVKELWTKSS
ncbi:hypothetical protein ACFLZX_01710 [Nanoarchaeota archaeon]